MGPVVALAILIVVVLALLLASIILRSKRAPVTGEANAIADPSMPPAAPTPSVATVPDVPESVMIQRKGISPGPVIEMKPVSEGSLEWEQHIAEIRAHYEKQGSDFEKRGTVVIKPEVEFVQLLPGDLKPVAVVPQAPDNQWIPDQLYAQMKQNGWALLHDHVREKLEPLVRAEYLRALVNADQVVMNRAFMFNNPAIYQDYDSAQHGAEDAQQVADSQAFKDLLTRGDIVPFLLKEQTPLERPEFGVLSGFSAWQQICQEVRPRCIRLDWDDARNSIEINQWMTRRFHQFAETAYTHNPTRQVQDLGLHSDAEQAFRLRLHELAEWCVRVAGLKIEAGKDPLVTRNEVYGGYDLVRRDDGTYQKGPRYIPGFVVADGTDPAQGLYDFDKPFGREIQRLVDLAYNSYLPDAIKGYPLTPTDALARTALQELEQAANQSDLVTGDQLVNLLQNAAFAFAEGGLSLPFMGVLQLSDVWQIRHMDEWLLYIQSVENLLRNPLDFSNPNGGARAIYDSYFALAQRIGKLVENRYEGRAREFLALWQPRIEFILDIGIKTLTLHWGPAGVLFSTKLSDRVVHGAVSVVGQLVVRGSARIKTGADLATSFVFMKKRLSDGQAGWDQMIDDLRRRGIKEAGVDVSEMEGTMSYQERPPAQ